MASLTVNAAPATANVLFLYATQALSTRRRIYVEACRELTREYGHQVVFCYNGPRMTGLDGLQVEHFETWVDANRERIERQSLSELERAFPASNFWRGIVIERNLTDYSFIGASSPMSRYSLAELEWYLKALVLFYDDVLERYRVDVAFNQVSDNIHAHILYELAQSKRIVPLSVGRGIYWFDTMVYPMTELSYGSVALRRRYRQLRDDPGALDPAAAARIEEEIGRMMAVEARQERPAVIYTKTPWTITANAVRSFRDALGQLTLRRPSVVESNHRLSLAAAVAAYLARLWNLGGMRAIVRDTRVPGEPFVFFPLHLQPEATLLGASPAWLDQLALVRLLSASLPAGYRLVVKDHPIIGGARPPAFYRRVKELKNVVLLDERVSGRTIARAPNCGVVATIGGTVGLEAMVWSKPVLIFGRAYYDCMDTLLKPPADLNDLPMLMKRVLVLGEHPAPEAIAADVKAFLSAWISLMRPAGRTTRTAQADEEGAGRDWARVVHELILQL